MNNVYQILHEILEFEETGNKQTNFKLNHDLANLMWSKVMIPWISVG